ncbi:MAG: M23 family metallopeptidase [Thermomicrobiales bacterium]|nr:M23 family metallopeptidase [Thermomicrobiales bacterium]
MHLRLSRRSALLGAAGLAIARRQVAVAQEPRSLPLAWPGRHPGDGFWIRNAFASENTWYNPGWWHCGEDWYALGDVETGGAEVLSVGQGRVVYVGSDYPGRVVIVEQEDGLYAMYGHMDPDSIVPEGTPVRAGDMLGTVYHRTDGRAPSHLHFEMRTFLFSDRVNGEHPEHGVRCGLNCPPGPGYWPMSAEHPAELGWRNPVLAMAAATFTGRCYVTESAPSAMMPFLDQPGGESLGEQALRAGDLVEIGEVSGLDAAATETSAEHYQVWGRTSIGGQSGWLRIVQPADGDTGSDGRPASVEILLAPERFML